MIQKMKAAVLTKTRQVEIKELEVPKVGPGDVLIRVRAAGICAAELHAFIGTHPVRKPPVQLGHEMAGEIAKVGPEVKKFKKGDRVSVFPLRHCGSCYNCINGKYNLCENLLLLGTTKWPGAFAEYIIAPENVVFKIPSKLTYQDAALAEPLCIGVHAVKRAGNLLQRSVAVIGVGTIGLACVVAARKAGAEKVYATDIKDYNLKVASRFGASLNINSKKVDPVDAILKATKAIGVDAVLITAGFTNVFDQAIKMVHPQGTIVTVALFDNAVTIDQTNLLVMGEKIITGSWGETSEDFKEGIEIIASGLVRGKDFITHRLPLESTKEGLELFERKPEDCIKIMLEIG